MVNKHLIISIIQSIASNKPEVYLGKTKAVHQLPEKLTHQSLSATQST